MISIIVITTITITIRIPEGPPGNNNNDNDNLDNNNNYYYANNINTVRGAASRDLGAAGVPAARMQNTKTVCPLNRRI